MGISLIFGRALSRKLWTGRQKAGLGARRYTTSSCKNGLIRWQYAYDLFSPELGRGWGKALVNCQFNSYPICIRLQFFVYLHRGKSQEAFSFFVVWGRKGVCMAGTGFQYGRYNASICVVLQCKVADIAWQDE